MLRLAHLSDLHYTTERRPHIRKILARVRQAGVDHLMITGDLTDSGSDVQMRGLFSLLHTAGFSDSQSLTVIPGNHDLYSFIYRTFDNPHGVVGGVRGFKSLIATARKIWDFRRQLLAYSADDYAHSLSKFVTHFVSAFETAYPLGERGGFPFVKLLPNDLALIGVDSNFLQPRIYGAANVFLKGHRVIRDHDITLLGENLSGSTGRVDTEALDAALSHPIVRGRRKIVLVHHCLYPLPDLIARTSRPYAMEMRLANRDETAQVLIRHNVDMVLHGHEHATEAYRLDLGIRVLNGGGAYSGHFHCLDVCDQSIRITAPDSSEGESQSSHNHEVVIP